MNHILKQLGIRRGEELRAGLMFSYIFLVIAALLIARPVRYSLFLTEFGPQQLPYAFILVALTSTLVALAYARLASRIPLNRLITISLLFFGSGFVISWFLLQAGYKENWFIYGFFIFAAIFGVISASQFWLLANYVFNAREAKRVFGFLGAGAIAGAIFGGYITTFLAPLFSTKNLVILCVITIFGNLLLLRLVWAKFAKRSYQESTVLSRRRLRRLPAGNPIKLILASRQLKYLAGLIGVGVLVASLVDYQFNAVASEQIKNEDQLTAFFGFWLSNLSIAALIVQFFLTGRILRKFGVGTSLYFLPGGVFVGALTVLFFPSLAAVVFIRLCEGGLKQSINKAGLELLSLPIPSGIKNRTKIITDMFVPNTAEGLGGILLLLLIIPLGLGVHHLSLVIIAAAAIWITLIQRVRREYVNSFRQAIEKRSVDLEDLTVNVNDASVQQIIRRVLEGNNSHQILYILQLFENSPGETILPYVERLISHPSNEVKAQILRLAVNLPEADLSESAKTLVNSSDEAVRVAAINYLCRSSEHPASVLESFAKEEDLQVRTSAMICAAQAYRSSPEVRQAMDIVRFYEDVFDPEKFLQLSGTEIEFLKGSAAEVIGEAQVETLYPHLHELLEDSSIEVVHAAVQSAGKTRATEFVPKLIEHLDTKPVQRHARNSLTQYGEVVIEELVRSLNDAEESKDVRQGVVKVLAMIGSQKSVNALLENLDQEDLELRYAIIKALNKLRADFSSLKFDLKPIEEQIEEEVRSRYTLSAILRSHLKTNQISEAEPTGTQPSRQARSARALLEKALLERLDRNLERIFRLLGLKYPPDDIYNSYLGIQSSNPILHANAVEFLDNLLDYKLKQQIIPIIEVPSLDESFKNQRIRIDGHLPTGKDYLLYLLEGKDDWLKACALFTVAHSRDPGWLASIDSHRQSADSILRETAEYAVYQLKVSR